MNKSTIGLLATVALVFSPVAAFAQQAQINGQNANNNAAAVGFGNHVEQDIYQQNFQTQVGADGYYSTPYDPQLQVSDQNASNNAAAIGEFNKVDQDIYQTSDQLQVDTPSYYPYSY